MNSFILASTSRELRVEISIGTSVENKKLVGEAESFSSEVPQLIGWTRIIGSQEPTEIQHVWICDGKEMSAVSLPVQSKSFRTFSRKTLFGKKGKWMLEVRDIDGKLLASKDFEVK